MGYNLICKTYKLLIILYIKKIFYLNLNTLSYSDLQIKQIIY